MRSCSTLEFNWETHLPSSCTAPIKSHKEGCGLALGSGTTKTSECPGCCTPTSVPSFQLSVRVFQQQQPLSPETEVSLTGPGLTTGPSLLMRFQNLPSHILLQQTTKHDALISYSMWSSHPEAQASTSRLYCLTSVVGADSSWELMAGPAQATRTNICWACEKTWGVWSLSNQAQARCDGVPH